MKDVGTGLSSGDESKVEAVDIKIVGNRNQAFIVYNRNSEFGPSYLKANADEFLRTSSLVQQGNTLILNDKPLLAAIANFEEANIPSVKK